MDVRKQERRHTHIEDLALLVRSLCQRLVDQPTALVVQDVGPDLANLFRRAVAIEVVVLDLEVLAHGDEDVERFLERRGGGDAGHVEREGDGEVERVVGGLVDDDEVVPVESPPKLLSARLDGGRRVMTRETAYFSSENLLKSTTSSGAVIKSIN